MKRVLKSFSGCVQTEGLIYNRVYEFIQVKDSPLLKYSRKWIELNEGKTEEEIRESMKTVDGWEVTLHELLFEEELN